MKTLLTRVIIALALLALSTINSQLSTVFAQGTAFTYQGRLNASGAPANGSYDLSFSIYKAPIGGVALAGPLTNSATAVTNGLFTVTLDFGSGVFAGQNCFMQINVETNGVGPYVALSPRQQLTPTPYAVFSENAAQANSVISNGVSVAQLNTLAAPASGEVLTYNGSSLAWSNPPAGGGSGWSLTGNSGTIPGTDFLGTSDNEPLELWVNDTRAFRLEPNANGLGYPNVIGGSSQNVVASPYGGAFIGGGIGNSVTSFFGVVAGGQENTASGSAAVGGGAVNTASGNAATIGGGEDNVASGALSTVSGGLDNTASGFYSFAAGYYAQATNQGAFVWADAEGLPFSSTRTNQFNVRANGGVRFVTGGAGMTIDGVLVGTGGGGGGSNANYTISTVQTTNSGLDSSAMGYQNTASGNYSTVAGGLGNTASGIGSFVGGGGIDGTFVANANYASGAAATVAGGIGNSASYPYAAVGGGWGNSAGGYYSAVSGGYSNSASTTSAFVGGGSDNTASGLFATIPGGDQNLASGPYSFAAGNYAQAVNQGAFVWADSEATPFSSTANDQFSVRAANGMRIVTGGNGMTGLKLDGYEVLTTATGGGGGGGITNSWLLTGNNGANPANGYFLGTMDTNGLELHVDGVRGLRLDYANESVGVGQFLTGINLNGGYSGNLISNGVVGGTIAGGGGQFGHFFNPTLSPNSVTGNFGTVGGGEDNTAGAYATVPGGSGNVASGQWSFAAGENATAGDNNSFIWGDGTRDGVSQGPDTFTVLATGGAYFYTTTGNLNVEVDPTGDVDFGSTTRQMLNLWGSLYGIGVQSSTLYQRTAAGGGFAWYSGGVHNNAQTNNGGGATLMTLDGSGDLNVTANASVCSLTIRGGCDLAEPFQFSSADKEIPQGAVVVIDQENPGHLKLSDQPYDSRVAGVVSGANGINPGIQMQQQGLLEGGKNVALTGRVYVQADASNGVIKPGDLLTTSATPGRAMRVTDHTKAQGAILGKAMTALNEGQGMVLVLVTLQ